MNHKITVFRGDGIGPELVDNVLKILKAANAPLEYEIYNVGEDEWKRNGALIPEEAYASFERTKVLLKSPITTPVGKGFRSLNVTLRGKYDLYANIRPVRSNDAVKTPFKNVDIVIFRENTEGLYVGVEEQIDPDTVHAIKIVTRKASERIIRDAFEYAKKNGRRKVTCVHKANILKMSDGMFLSIFKEIAKEYPEIEIQERLVDAMCAKMLDPEFNKGIEVVVLPNLYGDIVTDIAGTTRDSIYTKYNKFGLNFYLVDTAGIRKKGKVNEDLEYYSVIRSIRAIENSDVCVLMLDATRGIESQDLNIFSLVQKNKKGLVVCVNKWDLVEDKSQKVIDTFMSAIRERLAPFTDFPILFISALTKQRILKVLETAKDVYENRQRRVPTAKLNEIMLPIIENYPPPAWKGKYIKIKYITQLPAGQVPSFVFFCNLPQWIKEPYKRFLENKIRENWNFTGTPINVFIREK